LTGEYVGADVVRNEITSQARAAVDIDPTVDTVFEIGGQDSKYIRLEHGVVLDFAMNKACAAGTGSFLEEQADKLQISIERDFGRLALSSQAPACLGERCTVFMESNLVHFQQQGASVEDLTAGLAYSIAQNYLNRVVHGRAVGRNVFFQGGVASNPSVVAAFRQLTGAQITVPPHHDVTGAIGAAILAGEEANAGSVSFGRSRTRFHGFDLRDRDYRTSVFECQGCVNRCEIARVRFGADQPLFYGARCERYEGQSPGRPHTIRSSGLPNFFQRREELLMRGYQEPERGTQARPIASRARVGIPRALLFYEFFPFWHRFLVELGAQVVVSDPTNPRTVRETQENAAAETCFPVKLMQGHVLNLMSKAVDWVLLPSVVGHPDPVADRERSIYCPYIQSVPHLVLANLGLAERGVGVLGGLVYLDDLCPDRPDGRRRSLVDLVRPLGLARRKVLQAAQAAEGAQRAFLRALAQIGVEALAQLDAWPRVAVLVGRPYSTNDPGLSNALPLKLHKLGVVPLPIDCLPLDGATGSGRFGNMYWQSGQRILAAARLIRADPRLHAIYVTHFGCGPDSFVLSYFQREMEGQLYLELEMDDHTADAGVNTRCEAFFDSLATQDER
jgi:predicted CoA-substrate-specific enzyme activase